MSEFDDKLNQILNNPQQLEKLLGIAKTMMGNVGGGSAQNTYAQHEQPPSAAPVAAPQTGQSGGLFDSLDTGLITKLARGFSSATGTAALLQAVTPHLDSERHGQLKRAVTVAQLVKVARNVLSE